MGRTKKVHANNLKLSEIADCLTGEPKAKTAKTRKATFEEPGKMEADEDSGKKRK